MNTSVDGTGDRRPGPGKTRSEVEPSLRTFRCSESTDEVARYVSVLDGADSVSLVSALIVSGASVDTEVRLRPADAVRLVDELNLIILKWGWRA